MRILLVAEESAGVRVMRALAGTEHQVTAVMTSEPQGRFRGAVLAQVARHSGYRVWPAAWVKDRAFAGKLEEEGVDLLLNAHSLYVVHEQVLQVPRIGCFNVHPGPLPEYAGLNSPSWALYNGERSHGVTVHWMVPRLDRGPIAFQERFTIQDTDSALTLCAKCVDASVLLTHRLLEAATLGRDAIPVIEQDPRRWRYFGRTVPQNGWVDWSRPARDILNFIRACDYAPLPSPWGQPKTRIGEVEFTIMRAATTGRVCEPPPGTVRGTSGAAVLAATADEWLRIEGLTIAERPVAPAELLRAGDRLEGAAALAMPRS